jgi:ribosomal silencing factor RsfS
MNNKHVLTGVAVTLLLSTLSVRADPLDVKLGLWEITYTTQMSGMPVPESALKGMSPEQRARIEAIMQKRQAQAPQSHTDKTCMTQEDLNHAFDKKDDAEEEKCTQTTVIATRTVQEYKIQCTGSSPRSGMMHLEALSRERVKSTIKMNLPNGAVNNQMSGRWLAADCGKVD